MRRGGTQVFYTAGRDALLLDPERGPESDEFDLAMWLQALVSRPMETSGLWDMRCRHVCSERPAPGIDDLTILALHVPEVTSIGFGVDERILSEVLGVAEP